MFVLSISQWLPCPLAIWNLLFDMAILLNLVTHNDMVVTYDMVVAHNALVVTYNDMVVTHKDMVVTHNALVNEWNKLPNDCVNASSVNMFKNKIDIYLIRAGYT